MTRTFSRSVLRALHESKILGVRAGSDHRYTWVWVVLVDGRVFVRSWNDKPTGWYRAFRDERRGTILVSDREVRVRARQTRSQRLRDAVSRAYAEKYTTTGSQKWVRGFADPRRAVATLELVPS